MKIHVSQPCPACQATTTERHPSWVAFEAQRGVLSEDEYFQSLGYLPSEPRPPQDIPCRKCKGTGEVEAWVPLDVLMPSFMAALRQFGKEAQHV